MHHHYSAPSFYLQPDPLHPDAVWYLAKPVTASSECLKCIVDDFGELQTLTSEHQAQRSYYWDAAPDVDECARQWRLDKFIAERLAKNELAAREATAALLRPARIAVEIGAPDEWGDTPIHVGPDPRVGMGVPIYRLAVGGNDCITVSQAQLAALLVAAQALCKTAPRPMSSRGVH